MLILALIQTASEYLQKAQELKDEITEMTAKVQERIEKDPELHDAIVAKEAQVTIPLTKFLPIRVK